MSKITTHTPIEWKKLDKSQESLVNKVVHSWNDLPEKIKLHYEYDAVEILEKDIDSINMSRFKEYFDHMYGMWIDKEDVFDLPGPDKISETEIYPELVALCLFTYFQMVGVGTVRIYEKFERYFKSSHLNNDYRCSVADYIEETYEPDDPVLGHSNGHLWDYEIRRKSDNQLVALVDIEPDPLLIGDYSWWDCEGRMPDIRTEGGRMASVPNGVKAFVIRQENFTKDFEEMLKTIFLDYDEYVEKRFNEYRMMPFPYPVYKPAELLKEYESLSKLASSSYNTRVGDKLISQFHRSIYHSGVGNGLTPYEAWYNDRILKACIENRIIFQTHLNPNKILQGFNVSKKAPKVTVFSAGRAKLIIDKYLSEFDTIFDPFSTFSGRLLGTIASGKRYIGIYPSELMVKESNDLMDFLRNNLIKFDATVEQLWMYRERGTYPCLFTCPPHSDKEHWPGSVNESKSCDEWIDICLNNFKCRRYVFVVDQTKKYKDFVKENIVTKSHLYTSNEKIIVIDK